MESYETNEQGDRVIPASRRADGSVRRERRVRGAYLPQEAQPVYSVRERMAARAAAAASGQTAAPASLSSTASPAVPSSRPARNSLSPGLAARLSGLRDPPGGSPSTPALSPGLASRLGGRSGEAFRDRDGSRPARSALDSLSRDLGAALDAEQGGTSGTRGAAGRVQEGHQDARDRRAEVGRSGEATPAGRRAPAEKSVETRVGRAVVGELPGAEETATRAVCGRAGRARLSEEAKGVAGKPPERREVASSTSGGSSRAAASSASAEPSGAATRVVPFETSPTAAALTPEAVRKSFALTGLWADDEEDEEDEEVGSAAGAEGSLYGRGGSASSSPLRSSEIEPETTVKKVRGRGSVRHPGLASRDGGGGYRDGSAWDDDERDAPMGRSREGSRRR